MSEGQEKENNLSEAIRLRDERRKRWQKEGERSLWKNLSMIGSLGWLVVVPTLAGVFFGRLLDHFFEQSIFWTGSLIFTGIVFGCYLAWQRIKEE